MLEAGYKELRRRAESYIELAKPQVIICEIATDTLWKNAVKWISGVCRNPLLLYLDVPKKVCLERNRGRPDYVSSREDIFFRHTLKDIKNLAVENGIELRIMSNLNEEEADNIVKTLSEELWGICY
jgi:thymidylate kinase